MGDVGRVAPRRDGTTGDEPGRAGRIAAVLFAIAGVLAFAAVAVPGTRAGALVVIGTVDVVIALVAWRVPWPRLGHAGLLTMAVVALVVIGGAMWATASAPAGFVPFLVLTFVWVGLYLPRWTGVRLAPVAVVAYLTPLVANDASSDQLGSVVVAVPVAVVVAEVVARKVALLQDALRQIEGSDRWRADLMSTLAHDVRSPLAIVEGALQTLEHHGDVLDAATRRRVLDVAHRHIHRINQLAAGLLDMDRVEAGTLRLDLQAVRVAAAATAAAGYANDGDVRVAVDPRLHVSADPDRLEQMLVNLLDNARRHGRPPIDLAAHDRGGQVTIVVRDHGAGVDDGDREALFERFGTGHRAPRSAGLGLWIVRQLAEAHGGGVGYEPADPGARFLLHLPRGPASGR